VIRRLFWVGIGAAGAIVVTRRLRRAARHYSPEGIAERAATKGRQVNGAIRDAVAEFHSARVRREQELVDALLVEPEAADEWSSEQEI
jgi:hypothetical protein